MINVDKLFQKSAAGIEFERTFDPPVEAETSAEHALWTQDDLNFDSPWSVKGEVFLTESEDLLLIGSLDFEMMRSCARCLQDVKRKEHMPLAIAFRDPRRNPLRDETVDTGMFEGLQEWVSLSDLYPSGIFPRSLQMNPEFLLNDYPVYLWIHRDLDIKPALREQVLIHQEQRVYCEENCPGLCPICGLRRDDENCHCDPQTTPTLYPAKEASDAPVQYPFAGLAELLDGGDAENNKE